MDYRVSHRCIKNEQHSFRPTWVPQGGSIEEEEVHKFLATRIPEAVPPPPPPRVNLANDPNTQSDHDSSFDEDLAPDLGHLVAPGGSFRVDRVELTKDAMRKYHTHHKGYVNPCQ